MQLDLIRPTENAEGPRDKKMEDVFNRHHGASRREFESGDAVYVKNFTTPNRPTWTPATVVQRRGAVMYDVYLEGAVHVRHANQLQPRAEARIINELCSAFDVPELVDNNEEDPESGFVDVQRRTVPRNRKKPERLQLQPQRKTYVS